MVALVNKNLVCALKTAKNKLKEGGFVLFISSAFLDVHLCYPRAQATQDFLLSASSLDELT